MKNETEEARARRLANLRPFSSTHQPKNRRWRKGIPNRATVHKLMLKEMGKVERRRAKRAAKSDGLLREPDAPGEV